MDGHLLPHRQGVPFHPPGDYNIIHVEREGFFDLASRAVSPAKVTYGNRPAYVTATVSLTACGVVSVTSDAWRSSNGMSGRFRFFAMALCTGYPVLISTVFKTHAAIRGYHRLFLFWAGPPLSTTSTTSALNLILEETPNADATSAHVSLKRSPSLSALPVFPLRAR